MNTTENTTKIILNVEGSSALLKLEIRNNDRVLAQFTNGQKFKYVGISEEILEGLAESEKPSSYFMKNIRNNKSVKWIEVNK